MSNARFIMTNKKPLNYIQQNLRQLNMAFYALQYIGVICVLFFLLMGMILTAVNYDLFGTTRQCSNDPAIMSGIVSSELATFDGMILNANDGTMRKKVLYSSSMGKCLEKCEVAFCKGAHYKSANVPCYRQGTGIPDSCNSFEKCVSDCESTCIYSGTNANSGASCFSDIHTVCQ